VELGLTSGSPTHAGRRGSSGQGHVVAALPGSFCALAVREVAVAHSNMTLVLRDLNFVVNFRLTVLIPKPICSGFQH